MSIIEATTRPPRSRRLPAWEVTTSGARDESADRTNHFNCNIVDMALRRTLHAAFKKSAQALTYLVMAPFAALSALSGLLFISIGTGVMALETLISVTGYKPNLGGEFIKGFGVKLLPWFNF